MTQSSQIPWNFMCDRKERRIICYKEATPGGPLRVRAGCQEDLTLRRSLELSVPPSNLWGLERDWRLELRIDDAYMIKPP